MSGGTVNKDGRTLSLHHIPAEDQCAARAVALTIEEAIRASLPSAPANIEQRRAEHKKRVEEQRLAEEQKRDEKKWLAEDPSVEIRKTLENLSFVPSWIKDMCFKNDSDNGNDGEEFVPAY